MSSVSDLKESPQESVSKKEDITLTEVTYQIEEATNEDGTVDVEINDMSYDEERDKITVEFFTPLGEKKHTEFDRPQRDDSSYEAVEFAESYIGSFGAMEQMDGSKVRADPNTWELQLQKTTKGKISHKIGKVAHSSISPLLTISQIMMLLGIIVGFAGFCALPLISLYSIITTPVLSISAIGAGIMWIGFLVMSYVLLLSGEAFFGWRE